MPVLNLRDYGNVKSRWEAEWEREGRPETHPPEVPGFTCRVPNDEVFKSRQKVLNKLKEKLTALERARDEAALDLEYTKNKLNRLEKEARGLRPRKRADLLRETKASLIRRRDRLSDFKSDIRETNKDITREFRNFRNWRTRNNFTDRDLAQYEQMCDWLEDLESWRLSAIEELESEERRKQRRERRRLRRLRRQYSPRQIELVEADEGLRNYLPENKIEEYYQLLSSTPEETGDPEQDSRNRYDLAESVRSAIETLMDMWSVYVFPKRLIFAIYDSLFWMMDLLDLRVTLRIVTNTGDIEYRNVKAARGQLVTSLISMGDFIDNQSAYEETLLTSSGAEELLGIIAEARSMDFIFLEGGKYKRANQSGHFYNRLHNHPEVDLKRYQIFTKSDLQESKADELFQQHCLFHSLALVREDRVSQHFGELDTTRPVDVNELTAIANGVNMNINIWKYVPSEGLARKRRIFNVESPNEETLTVDLALHSNHYFLFEDTKYTKAIFPTKSGKPSRSEKPLNSLKLLVELEARGFTYHDPILHDFVGHDFVPLTTSEEGSCGHWLDYLDTDQNIREDPLSIDELDKSKLDLKKIPPLLVFADTEAKEVTTIDKDNKTYEKVHDSLFLGYAYTSYKSGRTKYERIDSQLFKPEQDNSLGLVHRMCLNLAEVLSQRQSYLFKGKLKSEISGGNRAIIYFHNLKYDMSLAFLDGFRVRKVIEQEGTLYGCETVIGGFTFEFRCSLKMLNMALSSFGKSFNLENQKKECIAYQWHHDNETSRKSVTIEEYLDSLNATYVIMEGFDRVGDRMRQQEILLDGIDESGSRLTETTFEPWIYYQHYMKLDCLTLKEGMEAFHTIIKDKFGLNSWKYLTIASLAKGILTSKGAFDEAAAVSGYLRKYISRTIKGGRVFATPEYQRQTLGADFYWPEHSELGQVVPGQRVSGKVDDLDFVNLYASAISRLESDGYGVPNGKAKRIRKRIPGKLNKSDWNVVKDKEDYYYIVEVNITKVNKQIECPILLASSEGSAVFSNSPPGLITVGKITLEEYIRYHDIEFEFVSGIYWSEGYSPIMAETLREMFQMRVKAKAEGNAGISETAKLLGNSAYGKLITRLRDTENKIVQRNLPQIPIRQPEELTRPIPVPPEWDDWNEQDQYWLDRGMHCATTREGVFQKRWASFLWKRNQGIFVLEEYKRKIEERDKPDGNLHRQLYRLNGTMIKAKTMNSTQAMITVSVIDKSETYPHLGCMILEMSKRIVNEVFGICRQLKVPVYYSDTDSLLLPQICVPAVKAEFKFQFGRELIGKAMGQLHSDFDLSYVGSNGDISKANNVYAEKAVFYDKKVYCTELVGIKSDGSMVRAPHFRMKGFNKEAIVKTAKERFGGDMIKLYEHICHHRLAIDNVTGDGKPRFLVKQWGYVATKTKDIRTIGQRCSDPHCCDCQS